MKLPFLSQSASNLLIESLVGAGATFGGYAISSWATNQIAAQLSDKLTANWQMHLVNYGVPLGMIIATPFAAQMLPKKWQKHAVYFAVGCGVRVIYQAVTDLGGEWGQKIKGQLNLSGDEAYRFGPNTVGEYTYPDWPQTSSQVPTTVGPRDPYALSDYGSVMGDYGSVMGDDYDSLYDYGEVGDYGADAPDEVPTGGIYADYPNPIVGVV